MYVYRKRNRHKSQQIDTSQLELAATGLVYITYIIEVEHLLWRQ